MNRTAGTSEYPDIQRHLLAMPAPAACLTGVGRIDSNILSASFFRFAEQFAEKFRPTRVLHALCQTVVVNHPVHLQVFDGDHAVGVDDLPAFLVCEIITAEDNALVDASNGLAMLAPFGRPRGSLAVLALHLCQSFLFFSEKAGIGNLDTIRECGKRREADINANSSINLRQTFGFALNGKASVPLASAALVDRERFDLPTDRTMQDDRDMPDTGQGSRLSSPA